MGRPRCCGAGRRRRGCRATWTSSRRRRRPSRHARTPGRTAPGRHLHAVAHISWCGKTRSEPPAWTSIVSPSSSSAMALHSMCQPGRPGPNGLSQTARPVALRARRRSRAGPSCRAGRGRRPARGRCAASPRATCRTARRTPGRRSPRSRGRPRPGRPRPASWSRWISSMTSGTDSTAPTYAAGGTTRSAVMSCRNSSVSRSASSRQSTPTLVARSSSGSSTSVMFCTYVTPRPACRQARTSRSQATYVAAWPMWVASYGVIPQAYRRAGPCGEMVTRPPSPCRGGPPRDRRRTAQGGPERARNACASA